MGPRPAVPCERGASGESLDTTHHHLSCTQRAKARALHPVALSRLCHPSHSPLSRTIKRRSSSSTRQYSRRTVYAHPGWSCREEPPKRAHTQQRDMHSMHVDQTLIRSAHLSIPIAGHGDGARPPAAPGGSHQVHCCPRWPVPRASSGVSQACLTRAPQAWKLTPRICHEAISPKWPACVLRLRLTEKTGVLAGSQLGGSSPSPLSPQRHGGNTT